MVTLEKKGDYIVNCIIFTIIYIIELVSKYFEYRLCLQPLHPVISKTGGNWISRPNHVILLFIPRTSRAMVRIAKIF